MEKPWKVVVAFLCVFVAGAVFGGVFTLGVAQRRQGVLARVVPVAPEPAPGIAAGTPAPVATPSNPIINPKKVTAAAVAGLQPGALTPHIMQQFTRRLELNTEQRERIRPAIARATEDLLRLRQENLADTARVTERMYEDIAALLTPEQRTELDKMRVQMQERVKAERLKRFEQATGGEGAPVRPKAQVPKQGSQ
jgi:hypothetical protein